jgi:hypothetical protein
MEIKMNLYLKKNYKVKWYDKKLWSKFIVKFGIFLSIMDIFEKTNYFNIKMIKCIFQNIFNWNILIAIILYLILFCLANTLKKIEFNINKIKVEIRRGDIFIEKGLKVIPFNEKFDTEVDDKIISKNSLNGKFLNRRDLVKDINSFKNKLKKEMKKEMIEGTDRYKLGSIFKWNNEYLITSFSKFDDKNQAYLKLENYYLFLEKFWENLSAIYSGEDIVIPLLGSGITRLDIEDEDLLKMILLTLKMSRKKFSKITIVLTENRLEKIDLYHLKELIN